MRHRFILLALAAMLALPPSRSDPPRMAAAPAPPRYPEVYALVYVGTGHNDTKTGRRIVEAINGIEGWIPPRGRERLRISRLEGTAVLRVWVSGGHPHEQAQVINHAVSSFFSETTEKARQNHLHPEERHKSRERICSLSSRLALLIKEVGPLCKKSRLAGFYKGKSKYTLTEVEEKKLKSLGKQAASCSDALEREWKFYDSLPRVLEWAAVKNE